MRPALTLEHFEHGNVRRVERVAFERLQMRGRVAARRGLAKLFFREDFIVFRHLFSIADSTPDCQKLVRFCPQMARRVLGNIAFGITLISV